MTPCLVSITQVSFANSGTKTINFTNIGGQEVDVFATVVGGANASDFQISNDHCIGQPLPSAATCALDIVFAPTSGLGIKSAQVALESAASVSLLSVALVGTGVPVTTPKPAAGKGFPWILVWVGVILAGGLAVGVLQYIRMKRKRDLLTFKLENKN